MDQSCDGHAGQYLPQIADSGGAANARWRHISEKIVNPTVKSNRCAYDDVSHGSALRCHCGR